MIASILALELGFATKSTAPKVSAWTVSLAPSVVKLLTIIVGRGLVDMISLNVDNPSNRGISTSRVITSGLNFGIKSNASTPSRAEPTTWNPGISPNRLAMVKRIYAESSTIKIRMGVFMS